MTQVSRDSKEITTLTGPLYLEAEGAGGGTATTPGYHTDRFQSAIAYVDIANASNLTVQTFIECSPDDGTYYRTTLGELTTTGTPKYNFAATHAVRWASMTGGSSFMLAAFPIGAYTRASVARESGTGDVSIRLGFKS